MNKCSLSLCSGAKMPADTECGTARPQSQFKVWQNSIGTLSVFNKNGEDVTDYFDVSIIDGTVVMNYKKAPSLEEWRKNSW